MKNFIPIIRTYEDFVFIPDVINYLKNGDKKELLNKLINTYCELHFDKKYPYKSCSFKTMIMESFADKERTIKGDYDKFKKEFYARERPTN